MTCSEKVSYKSSTSPQLCLLLLFHLVMPISVSVSSPHASNLCSSSSSSPSCDPQRMCSSKLVKFLLLVQSAALKSLGPDSFDPKLYVDLSLKYNLEDTVSAFDSLPRSETNGVIPVSDFEKFVDRYFDPAGSDLVISEPADFVEEPEEFLPKVENHVVRAWALRVHSLWRTLGRKVADSVKEQPMSHTTLPLPYQVFIPGSRFREVYYWDSYWIVRGLLASKMYESAKAVVNNLIFLVEEYGFVPNGARSYYINRSQPPLLSSMVRNIYDRTGDVVFLERALPSLLKEHAFWSSGIHSVMIQDVQGSKHCMSRYYAMWNKPRPESATIDIESASRVSGSSQKANFYRQVASTAESGWDFSSRWMRNSSDFTTLSTTRILPVDLNAFIVKMERDIAFFEEKVGNYSISKKFSDASRLRWSAFNSIFWNTQMDQWVDYWLPDDNCHVDVHHWDSHNQHTSVFASNLIPVWIDMCNSDKDTVTKITRSLKTSGLLLASGIATSLSNTGQQWDFPNGWAPLQHMIIEGLVKSGLQEAKDLAEEIAIRWLRTNYVTYKETGVMHEKYDVVTCGLIGGGGEYNPQTGFGWSNGVVLALLEEFGWPKDRDIECV